MIFKILFLFQQQFRHKYIVEYYYSKRLKMRAAFNQTPALCRGVYGIKEAAGAERRCRPASTNHNRIPPVYIQIGAPLGRRFFHHFVTLAFASYNAVCRFSSPSFRPSLPTWDCSHPAFHRRLQSGWCFVFSRRTPYCRNLPLQASRFLYIRDRSEEHV